MRSAIGLSLATLVVCSSAAFADDETPPVVGGKTYIQHQILAAKTRHPEILDITVIGKRPEERHLSFWDPQQVPKTFSNRRLNPPTAAQSQEAIISSENRLSEQHCSPAWNDRDQVPQPARPTSSLRQGRQRSSVSNGALHP